MDTDLVIRQAGRQAGKQTEPGSVEVHSVDITQTQDTHRSENSFLQLYETSSRPIIGSDGDTAATTASIAYMIIIIILTIIIILLLIG